MTTIKLKNLKSKKPLEYHAGQWFKTTNKTYPIAFLSYNKGLQLLVISDLGHITPWSNKSLLQAQDVTLDALVQYAENLEGLTPISVTISED